MDVKEHIVEYLERHAVLDVIMNRLALCTDIIQRAKTESDTWRADRIERYSAQRDLLFDLRRTITMMDAPLIYHEPAE